MSTSNSNETLETDNVDDHSVLEDTLDTSEYCDIEYLPTDIQEVNQNNDNRKNSPIVTQSKVNSKQLNLFALLTLEPQTVDEAVNSMEKVYWKQAMDDEIKSHKINKTWE